MLKFLKTFILLVQIFLGFHQGVFALSFSLNFFNGETVQLAADTTDETKSEFQVVPLEKRQQEVLKEVNVEKEKTQSKLKLVSKQKEEKKSKNSNWRIDFNLAFRNSSFEYGPQSSGAGGIGVGGSYLIRKKVLVGLGYFFYKQTLNYSEAGNGLQKIVKAKMNGLTLHGSYVLELTKKISLYGGLDIEFHKAKYQSFYNDMPIYTGQNSNFRGEHLHLGILYDLDQFILRGKIQYGGNKTSCIEDFWSATYGSGEETCLLRSTSLGVGLSYKI